MARPNAIIYHELEHLVIQGRAQSKTRREILDDLNEELAIRWSDQQRDEDPPTIGKSVLDRYTATLDKATTPALHEPKMAAANAGLAVDLGTRIQKRLDSLETWLDQVEKFGIRNDEGEIIGTDWEARKKIMSEEREWLKFIADVLDKAYHAGQVQRFQAIVVQAIGEVDPETAQKIEARLRESADVRRAAMLGLAA